MAAALARASLGSGGGGFRRVGAPGADVEGVAVATQGLDQVAGAPSQACSRRRRRATRASIERRFTAPGAWYISDIRSSRRQAVLFAQGGFQHDQFHRHPSREAPVSRRLSSRVKRLATGRPEAN